MYFFGVTSYKKKAFFKNVLFQRVQSANKKGTFCKERIFIRGFTKIIATVLIIHKLTQIIKEPSICVPHIFSFTTLSLFTLLIKKKKLPFTSLRENKKKGEKENRNRYK